MFARILLLMIVLCAPAAAREQLSPLVQQGTASIYADSLQGRRTASGEPHDQNDLTGASRVLPLGARVKVTNLENGRSVDVEINDRGPFARGRVIDLSRRAAADIGLHRRNGIARVKVEAHPNAQPTPELRDEVARLAAARAGKRG